MTSYTSLICPMGQHKVYTPLLRTETGAWGCSRCIDNKDRILPIAPEKPEPKRRRIDHAQVDLFAEALSVSGNVASVAASFGFSRQRGHQILNIMKADLGWQAS